MPKKEVLNNSSFIEQEASVSKINDEQLLSRIYVWHSIW